MRPYVRRIALILAAASAPLPALTASASAQITYERIANLSTMGGLSPLAGLVRGSDGALYGTTSEGGTGRCGMVYRVTLTGQLSVIHQFARPQGCYPVGDLAVGPDGALYGVTYLGGQATGNGFGTVYRITLQGAHTVLKVFSGAASDTWPYAGLTLGPDGHFYGTTIGDSVNPSGTVFRISQQGDYTALSSVVNSQAALTLGADGHFYGTIHQTTTSVGAIFRITLGGALTIIHELPFDPLVSPVTCPEGREPMAELVPGPDGNFYSTTRLCGPDPTPGGTYSEGTIFRITPGGTLTTLLTFERDPTTYQAPLGANPWAGLTLGSDGHFYGIASSGGPPPTTAAFSGSRPGGPSPSSGRSTTWTAAARPKTRRSRSHPACSTARRRAASSTG